MQIRLMTQHDAPHIADLLNDEIESGVAHFSYAPTSPEEVLGEWDKAGERYPWLVAADENGAMLGFARGSSWNTREAYRWTVATAIYLLPAAQGRGTGRALYEALFAMLARQGYAVAIAGVSIPNPASERLHEAMGMSRWGDITPAGFKHGRWIPVRWYQKQIGECRDGAPPGEIRPMSKVWNEIQRERSRA